jgi:LysR family transcriptional regulator, regulator for bpeEF and oprC
MDLQSLQAFVKVVQTGSFTRAAEALDTQKAHLSRQVSALERALGVRLLERTTRSLSLTEAGREFFERAVGILAAVEDAQRAMQRAQGEPRGTLRLTCGYCCR